MCQLKLYAFLCYIRTARRFVQRDAVFIDSSRLWLSSDFCFSVISYSSTARLAIFCPLPLVPIHRHLPFFLGTIQPSFSRFSSIWFALEYSFRNSFFWYSLQVTFPSYSCHFDFTHHLRLSVDQLGKYVKIYSCSIVF